MQLSTRNLSDALLIVPAGPRLDASASKDFQAEIKSRIEAGDSRLIVDLSLVDFMDSSGLNALVAVMKTLGGQGKMALFGIQRKVAGIFRLTRMDKVFIIRDSEEDALAAVKGD